MKKRSGLTRTGFSLSFGCCGRSNYCNLGKGTCYYERIDPEVPTSCNAWVRNHKSNLEENADSQINQNHFIDEELDFSENEELHQLSLFD
ncbi:hypothetical protein [Bacillus cihuensis]|uniref:hypothetical protein n=1 Tax=Bacillus cihuensis TaxID=1208599 RepID=UPI000556A1D6|nr:hypothetical protein [Bacillus cihuensis]